MSTLHSYEVLSIPTTDDRLNLRFSPSVLDKSNESILTHMSPEKQPHEILSQLKKEEERLKQIRLVIINKLQHLQIEAHALENQLLKSQPKRFKTIDNGDDKDYYDDKDLDDENVQEMRKILSGSDF